MMRWLRPVAIITTLLLSTGSPVLAQSRDTSPSEGTAATSPSTAERNPTDAPKTSSDAKKPISQQSLLMGASAGAPGGPPVSTLSVDAFQTDLFTGAATAEVAIPVPLGAAGTAPRVLLRYNSSSVDELGPRAQGQWTGLGWSLDLGGFIVRDAKQTTSPHDDTFKLVFGGVSHDLVRVDAINNIFHTRDEAFVQLMYVAQSDYWLLTTKDGVRHRFGFNPDSMAIALGPDLTTPVAWKYLLDEVTTPSGVTVRYAYVKQTASAPASGRSYDQAVYPQTVTWSYASGALVGPAREVRFLRAPRADWTDTSASAHVSFHERERLDAIEVRVGGQLVSRYGFGFDYSTDRDPTHTWDSGVAGDLSLRSITVVGADGASALPAQTFSYSGAYLASASNGLGGAVSFAYEHVPSHPLYPVADFVGEGDCRDWRPAIVPHPLCGGPALGHLLSSALPGTVPLYSTASPTGEGDCRDWRPATAPNSLCGGPALGHLLSSALPGTVPLYSTASFAGEGDCTDWRAGVAPLPCATLLGYIYAGPINRHRVVTRTVTDGRGATLAMRFNYSGLGLADGNEFRGHAAVRAIDPAGHYTDTWFRQDDVFKGRMYQSETRSSDGRLFIRVANSWTSATPVPGVTLVTLARIDTYNFEGGPAVRQTAQSFEYDVHGNPTRVYHWGDVAVAGDERDERTQWVVNTAAWLHRTIRVALHDAAGAVVRERWLSYDGLAWGSLGSRGLVTRDERRLSGTVGTAANPVVVYTYDVYGNRVSSTDPRGCVTSVVFETSRTYPTSVTTCQNETALRHTTTFQYDARWGVKTRETDPNAQTTTYTYDVFGRLSKVVGPLDTSSLHGSASYVYSDLGNASLQRVTVFRTAQHGTANYQWSERHFDGLGRIYKESTQFSSSQPGSDPVLAETFFDSRGLAVRRTAPRRTVEPVVATDVSYDPLGRPIQVRFPDGATVSTAYGVGLRTMTDRRGNVQRNFGDAYGQLVRVEEVNGPEIYVTTYQYDATGALTRVGNHLGQPTAIAYDVLGRKISIQDPNMGVWRYAYDAGGNLISQRDAKGQILTFTYDALGRIRTKRYPTGAQITWTYDDRAISFSRGRLTRVSDLATTSTFRYDRMGRITQTDRLLDGTTYRMSHTYDALSRVTSTTFPDNEVVRFQYNSAGWLAAVPGYIDTISYTPRGQRTRIGYANGTTSNFAYDAQTFRLTGRSTTVPGGPGPYQDFAYTYDANGNITQVTDRVATASRTLAYDALNRLTSATGRFGPTAADGLPASISENYSYDAVGNFRRKGADSYAYSDPAHPSAVTSIVRPNGTTSFGYDANGNLTTGAGRASTWDADNRLTATTIQGGHNATFKYDYAGTRVRKQVGQAVTRFPSAGYEIDPFGVVTKYITLGDEIVAARRKSGTTLTRLFYHADHLGGVHLVTDINGALVQRVEYKPWGEVARQDGNVEPSRRFTGKELDDPEIGLLYYGGRYYSSLVGRFVSPDPFVPAPGSPQSLNRYAYVLNNPINLIDPSGFFFRNIGKFFKARLELGWKVARVAAPILIGVTIGLALTPYVGPVAAGFIAGAVSGALNTALNGGNLALNIIVGATFGAIGGAIGPPLSSAITQATGSAFVGAVGSAAITGAGFGAASAGMAGGDVGQGALWGAATGAVLSAVMYAGYNAAQSDLSGPGSACDDCALEDTARVRPFARRILGTPAFHKGIEVSFPEGMAYYEMGPDANWRISISESFNSHEGLIAGTQAALERGAVVYGEWSVVSRAALTTQQSLYEARWVGQPYYPTYRNSNYYVDFVLRGAGANPRVPGVFAPSF
jgi:RHS repeat-associated protein